MDTFPKLIRRHNYLAGALAALLLAGCSTPATVKVPDSEVLELRHKEIYSLANLPAAQVLIQPGDTLDISRNSPFTVAEDDHRQFMVRPDGKVAVREAGLMDAAGLSPEELADKITERFKGFYREPRVTVNIIDMPSNQIFIGGAVRNPTAVNLNGNITVEQALLGSGGLLPSADSENIALLRVGSDGKYNLYFFNLASLLEDADRPVVLAQRGDIIFAPQSGIGSTVEAVDMYITRMIPLNLGVGVGYDLNADN